MDKYGLIGWPVAHSVSPPMQNAGFTAANIDANYEKVAVAPEDMDDVIPKMKESFSGWNCTVPHKQHIIEFLDDIDPLAKALGSVNTVVNKNGKLKGYSTDGYGMQISLKESFNKDIKDASILFIGAGGAARAVALHFALEGAEKIAIINRSEDKAKKIAEEINILNPNTKADSDSLSCQKINLDDYEVIIQSTSLGLHADDPSPFDATSLNSSHLVVDMIYKETPFLKQAKEIGCKTIDGEGMLLHQGVKAWEIWTNEKGPVEEMRQALKKALGKDS
ncbi:MAG: shikimate dehydrogenase [Lentisphaeraceae bacterium]|nr:shikimate dehydrogenase [Lentisphaeraceae bacterium]